MSVDIRTCVYIGMKDDSIELLTEYVCEDVNSTVSSLYRDSINDQDYIPKKGDKIFLMKGCNVPRFKIKQFCLTHGVSLVKYEDKANVRFIGPNTINSFIDTINGYFFNKEKFVITLKEYKTKNLLFPFDNTLLEDILLELDKSTSSFVVLDYPVYIKLGVGLGGLSYLGYNHRPKVRLLNKEIYLHYQKIVSDPSIYKQYRLLGQINTGGALSHDDYISIQRLLSSSDIDNVKLAMEAMANSDYKKSSVYLLLLIKDYWSAIYSSPTIHHVNFKSLLKFFDIGGVTYFNLNKVLDCLIKAKLLNKTNLDILRPLIIQEMKDQTSINYFEISNIEQDPLITQSLEENILDVNCNTEVIEEDEEEIKIKN